MEMAQAVFDLVAHPEYIEPLRDEVKRVKVSDGNTWTKAGIAKLVKMDSFMKESQRFRPPGLGTTGCFSALHSGNIFRHSARYTDCCDSDDDSQVSRRHQAL